MFNVKLADTNSCYSIFMYQKIIGKEVLKMDRRVELGSSQAVSEGDLAKLAKRAPGTRVELLLQAVGRPGNESILRRRSMGMAIETHTQQMSGTFSRPC